ncbi:hypothetical protein POPTR_011G107800v4 [Populus trichocarpa]|uniref:Uncharacterized protein n=2 Tax=Populus trichocarpa TaxID=3694 RepID=A0ACC0S8N3_POPTR|nr:uncharacterized protein LOC7472339 isoform X2 [Populus trichocarpa]KAI9385744.1 hypothetical protein POPTR_011G107800v4 [Populus trichocarpa]
MRRSHFSYTLVLAVLSLACTFQFQAHAAPPAPLVKHLSSLLKWTTTVASLKTPQSDENVLQFEDGYLVETVVKGNAMGVVPYKIRLSEDGELYAVDEVNSNVVKISPPLSQYSRARLVAGSFQGYTGHIDGKPNEVRFNHPRGLTMDDKGNIYVADSLNHAIRKIGDAGVTTIAGGKSNVAGFRDGPSEDAKFSNDFDVVYVHSTCSLLVVDRGNAALRQISLNQEDCDYQSSSFTMTDVLMVVGAVLIGYATCMLQLGFGSSSSSRMQQSSESEYKEKSSKEKPIPIVDNMKEEPKWPSFGQLFIDLSKLALEALVGILLSFVPSWYKPGGARKGLTPLKDSLIMPDDEVEPPSVQRQSTPAPVSENRQVQTPTTSDKYSEMKLPKIKSASFKDPSPLSKHRSSKQQEYAEFYGSGEVPSHGRSKSHKEKSRHRQRDKSGEVVFGAVGAEPKPAEMNPVDYNSPKFNHYNNRSKYGSDSLYRF